MSEKKNIAVIAVSGGLDSCVTAAIAEQEYEIALARMRQHGAEVTTTEAILFELLNVCGTDVFKQISKIVK